MNDTLAGGLSFMAGRLHAQRYADRRAQGLPLDTGDRALLSVQRVTVWVVGLAALFLGALFFGFLVMNLTEPTDTYNERVDACLATSQYTESECLQGLTEADLQQQRQERVKQARARLAEQAASDHERDGL